MVVFPFTVFTNQRDSLAQVKMKVESLQDQARASWYWKETLRNSNPRAMGRGAPTGRLVSK